MLLRSILRIPIPIQLNTASPETSLKWSIFSSAYKAVKKF